MWAVKFFNQAACQVFAKQIPRLSINQNTQYGSRGYRTEGRGQRGTTWLSTTERATEREKRIGREVGESGKPAGTERNNKATLSKHLHAHDTRPPLSPCPLRHGTYCHTSVGDCQALPVCLCVCLDVCVWVWVCLIAANQAVNFVWLLTRGESNFSPDYSRAFTQRDRQTDKQRYRADRM